MFLRNKQEYTFEPKILIKCVDDDYQIIQFVTEEAIVHRRQEVIMQTVQIRGKVTIKTSIKELEKKYRYVEVTELTRQRRYSFGRLSSDT